MQTLHPHKINKRVASFRQGQTIYAVHALGCGSDISKYVVLGRARYSKYGTLLLQVKECMSNHRYIHPIALEDFNIPTNNYNNHRLFTSRSAAEKYHKYCLTQEYYSVGCGLGG